MHTAYHTHIRIRSAQAGGGKLTGEAEHCSFAALQSLLVLLLEHPSRSRHENGNKGGHPPTRGAGPTGTDTVQHILLKGSSRPVGWLSAFHNFILAQGLWVRRSWPFSKSQLLDNSAGDARGRRTNTQCKGRAFAARWSSLCCSKECNCATAFFVHLAKNFNGRAPFVWHQAMSAPPVASRSFPPAVSDSCRQKIVDAACRHAYRFFSVEVEGPRTSSR